MTKDSIINGLLSVFVSVTGYGEDKDLITKGELSSSRYESRDQLCSSLGIQSGKENAKVSIGKKHNGKPTVLITHWTDINSEGRFIEGIKGPMPVMIRIRPTECIKHTENYGANVFKHNIIQDIVAEKYGRAVLKRAMSTARKTGIGLKPL